MILAVRSFPIEVVALRNRFPTDTRQTTNSRLRVRTSVTIFWNKKWPNIPHKLLKSTQTSFS